MVNHIIGGIRYAAKPPSFIMLANVKLSMSNKNKDIKMVLEVNAIFTLPRPG